jgi:inosine-uridine nucleoside N-ribohydrolase
MAKKIAIIADPGIDVAFAVALGLFDPDLELLGLGATGGNVSPEQATNNVHVLIEQMDPARWPRVGDALPVEYDINGTHLHGPDGLGGIHHPCYRRHNLLPTDKLISDLVQQYPTEVTVICMGPMTALAAVLERDPEFPTLVRRLICLGGTLHEPGNAGPVSEFHFACDPLAARMVLQCGAEITLVPLDVMRMVLFSPSDLLQLPNSESRTCKFLKEIVPFGIGATSNLYGIEGFHLKDVLGIVAAALPGKLTTEPMLVDVETRGELTRGMLVIDRRARRPKPPNVEMVVEVDSRAVRNYIDQVLRGAG